jgi:hypothetical protein
MGNIQSPGLEGAEMRRGVFGGAVALMAAAAWISPSAAQTDPIKDVTDPIKDAVEETADTVQQTTNNAVGAVGQTANDAGGAAGQTANDAGGAVNDAAGAVSNAGGGGGAGDVTDGGSLGDAGSRLVGDGGTSDGAAGSATSTDGAGARARPGPKSPGRSAGSKVDLRPLALPAPRSGEEKSVFATGLAGYLPLLVRLTNDADGDGTYTDSEAAPQPAADVPLRIQLENTGSRELTILQVRDSSPDPMAGVDASCASLMGIQLVPGQSTTCSFTAEGLAPPDDRRLVAVLEVDATDQNVTGTVADTTIIATGAASVLGQFQQALAGTGAQIILLVGVATGLLASGMELTRLGNRRARLLPPPRRPWGGRMRAPEDGRVRHPRRTVRRYRRPADVGNHRGHHQGMRRTPATPSSRGLRASRAVPRSALIRARVDQPPT